MSMPPQSSAPPPTARPSVINVVRFFLRLPLRILRLERISSGWIVAAAGVLFVLSTALALWQYLRPYTWHTPYQRFHLSWWLQPAEWNIDAGLPEIKGNINAIAFVPDGKRLWIAGDAGLLAFSDDQGASWIFLEFDVATQQFRVPVQNAPATASSSSKLWEIPKVYAAEDAGSNGERSDRPGRQSSAANQAQQQAPANQAQQQVPNQQSRAQQPVSSALVATPNPVEFGNVRVNNDKTFTAKSSTVTVTNKGPNAAKISLGATRELGWGQFDIRNNTCNGGLEAGQTCSLLVAFKPNSVGDFTAHLRDNTDATNNQLSITLHGRGIAGASSTPTPTPTPRQGQPTPTPTPATPLSSAPDLVELQIQPRPMFRTIYNLEFLSTDGGQTWHRDPTQRESIFPRLIGGRWQSIRRAEAGISLTEIFGSNGPGSFDQRATVQDPESKIDWIAGTQGVILRRDKGVENWVPVTRSAAPDGYSGAYTRFLPPWYWLALGLCGVLMLPLLAPPVIAGKVEEYQQPPDLPFSPNKGLEKGAPSGAPASAPAATPASGIGNQAISDRPLEPGDPDALGLSAIAAGLAFFLRNDKTRPPLVLAINGRWGSGKSSLMNLLKKELQDSGTCPVWFNAWHHQKESQLLAALLQAVRAQAIPALSTWRGWVFRGRLAWTRLRKYWFRLAALAGIIFLLYRLESFLVYTHTALNLGSLLNLIFNPDQSGLKGLTEFLKNNPTISIITGLAAAIKTISRGLTAFGANPAALLTTTSGGSKEKELDAQTSFRQKFSADFAEVTHALGTHRMLILIDDLDRCRPEKVRETLEAVNFLVSSGECFLVLGMAREIVEHCVGLSFARVVDSMGWDAIGLADEEIEQVIQETKRAAEKARKLNLLFTAPDSPAGRGSSDVLSVEAAAKRRAFARLYMDKLVQIEVAVPEPTPAQRRLLFQTDQERVSQSAAERHVARALRTYAGLSRWLTPVAQAVVIGLSVAVAGLSAGHYLKPWALQILPQQAASPSHTAVSTPTPVPTATPGERPTPTPQKSNAASTPTPTPTPAPAPTPQQLPSYQPGNTATHLGIIVFWPLVFAVILGLGALGSSLRQVAPRKVTDTQVFVNALKIWQRLVMTSGARNTPRTARRFQNRVRYLAMRQRALSEGPAQSRLERWLRRRWQADKAGTPPVLLPGPEAIPEIEARATAVQKFMGDNANGDSVDWSTPQMLEQLRQVAAPVPPQYLLSFLRGNIYIPEPILVGLAALEEYEPAWVREEKLYSKLVLCAKERVENPQAQQVEQRYEVLLEVVSEHLKAWDNWSNMEHYRRAYLQLGSEAYGEPPEGPKTSRSAGAGAGG
jgi:hypothetical protein